MTAQLMSDWISPFSLGERMKALAQIGHDLTLHARNFGTHEEASACQKLLGINELQHKLFSQIRHYLNKNENYSIEDFCKAMFEMANHYDLNGVLGAAIKSAQTRK